MAETPGLRLYEPRLKAHRLVPADKEGMQPKECLQVADLPNRETALSCFEEHQAIFSSEGAGRLAAQARGITSEAAQLLQRLPAVLETLEAPRATHQAAMLLRSILTTLPDELSNKRSSTIAQIDWAFVRMLNQPGQPGFIEQVLMALGAPSEGEAVVPRAEAHEAEIEGLRQLHRDLVSLQQEWDALVEALLPPPPAPPACAPEARPSNLLAMPAPMQGIILKKRVPEASRSSDVASQPAQPVTGTGRSSSHWLHRARTMRVRVAMTVVLLFFLVGSGLGVLMLKNMHPLVSDPQAAAALVHHPGPPGVAATSTPAPTATELPIASPTPPPPAPKPKSTPTPLPSATPIASANFWCPSATQLCVSNVVLAVPCASQGSATLQLKNATPQPRSWQVISSKIHGSPLVRLSASSGQLQPGQVATLTVTAATVQQHQGGMLTITNSGSKGQIFVGLLVCG